MAQYNVANPNYNSTQAAQQAAYHAQKQDQVVFDSGNDQWKSALSGLTPQGLGALSGLGGAVLGNPIQPKSLQDEADRVRAQSYQLNSLLGTLQYRLFDPSPATACGQNFEKDIPSTVEGNLQDATRTLESAILTLDNILGKIGGR